MGYKLKRIMMRPNGVEKQVRPKNGKSFDFTTQSKTALTNAGWVFQSNVVINGNGLYNGGSGAAYSYFPISKTSSNTITIKVTFKGTNISSWTGSLGTGFGGGTDDYFYGTYKGLLTNYGYTFRWRWNTGGSAGSDISWSSNTWYVETLTFNLPSKTLTSKITTEANPSSVISNQSANISSYVSSIVSQPGVYIRSDGVSRVKNISYEIS